MNFTVVEEMPPQWQSSLSGYPYLPESMVGFRLEQLLTIFTSRMYLMFSWEYFYRQFVMMRLYLFCDFGGRVGHNAGVFCYQTTSTGAHLPHRQ
jgi:hypothetical protein